MKGVLDPPRGFADLVDPRNHFYIVSVSDPMVLRTTGLLSGVRFANKGVCAMQTSEVEGRTRFNLRVEYYTRSKSDMCIDGEWIGRVTDAAFGRKEVHQDHDLASEEFRAHLDWRTEWSIEVQAFPGYSTS